MTRFLVGVLSLFLVTFANAADGRLKSDPAARLFGSHPDIRGVRLSPSGSKLSFLKTHPDGYSIASVLDLENPKMIAVLESEKDENDLAWCRWVNEERLLCAFTFQEKMQGRSTYFGASRLMAVNFDATEPKLMLEHQLDGTFSQNQANVIDWMGDDPNSILIQTPNMRGSGVGKLDVYSGRFDTKERDRDFVYAWISDGHGNPRLYNRVDRSSSIWFIVKPGALMNEKLRETSLMDFENMFNPRGFGEDTNELLYLDWHEGRMALFGMQLEDPGKTTRLVYSHPEADVIALQRMGKYDRLVGAIYALQTVAPYYFDNDIRRIYDQLKVSFPDKNIGIIDEDWEQRNYLVVIGSDTEPGTFYIFDSQESKLKRIGPLYSSFANTKLSKMESISYSSRDGTNIPAYLSLPASGKSTDLPAVILPHGGPSARDVWGFDYLVQYLTAKGYAVLQGNYRGSSGYGRKWLGDGAFQGWRTAINDITDGAQHLVNEGIADPDRICVVGWSFGGYAALLSGVEEPDLYKCIVSVAGVSDPESLGWGMMNFVGGNSARSFIGTEDNVIETGSPLKRVAEIQAPVLMFHAEKDLNVPIKQSEDMVDALKQNKKSVEYITYEHAEHSIVPERYRIDMLTRLGEFLDKHTK